MDRYKENEFVEGKGYFVSYLCKHCKRIKLDHFQDGHCLSDKRKRFPDKLKTTYEEDITKPKFTKFIL